MSLARLLYYSSASEHLQQNDIRSILSKSIKYNTHKNITGVLVYDKHYFMQLLDGDRDEVNELYNRVIQDPRHSNIRLIHYGALAGQRFTEWSMGIAYLPSFPKARIEANYGGFFPPKFTVEDAVQYLLMISEYTAEFMDQD